jgi:tetratricopeptide (TPR) repeat protein
MHLAAVVEFLRTTDELKTAKELLNTFAKYAKSIEQYDELGMLYEKIKAYPESLKMLEKCLVTAPHPQQLKAVRANLAKVYNHVNDPDKSLFYSNLNLEMNPNDYEARMEQTFSYYLRGEYEKSNEIQIELLKVPNLPDNVKKRITFNMGTFEMYSGNFKEGLYKMVMGGKEIGIWKPLVKPYPKWTGEETDRTILIYAEAGIGDEIINIRFCHELDKRGLKYLWVGHRKDTNELFKTNGYRVISTEDLLDPTENYVYCESMSLPILLDLDKDELWNGPYLKPKQEYIDKWKAILPEKFITARWCGNPYYDQDLHRTVNKEQLLETLAKSGLPVVSLQLDEHDDSLINPEIKDWDDTIAIQYLAHLNVTSCTSTVHSASAIGAKCVVLPPICTYYPWVGLKDDNTSYWYSENTKAFVQSKHKDWTEPLSKLEELL